MAPTIAHMGRSSPLRSHRHVITTSHGTAMPASDASSPPRPTKWWTREFTIPNGPSQTAWSEVSNVITLASGERRNAPTRKDAGLRNGISPAANKALAP